MKRTILDITNTQKQGIFEISKNSAAQLTGGIYTARITSLTSLTYGSATHETGCVMPSVPIQYKILLTLEEASAYSGIGVNRLRTLSYREDFERVIFVSGRRRLFKRHALQEYLEHSGGVCYD